MIGISPEIVPTRYDREDSEKAENVAVQRYTFDGVDTAVAQSEPRMVRHSAELWRWHGEPYNLYVGDGHCHVSDSTYRSHPMVMLREHCLDVLATLADDDLIVGLRQMATDVRR